MPGTEVSAYIFTLNPHQKLEGKYYYYPHFINEENETYNGDDDLLITKIAEPTFKSHSLTENLHA